VRERKKQSLERRKEFFVWFGPKKKRGSERRRRELQRLVFGLFNFFWRGRARASPSLATLCRMAKLADYSKFDKLVDSDDEQEEVKKMASSAAGGGEGGEASIFRMGDQQQAEFLQAMPTIASDVAPTKMTKKGKEGRFKFEHDGRTIYEWEQSLEEVNLYIEPPEGIPRNMFDVVISHRHLRVGIKGAPPFIDEDTGGPVKPDESMWMLSDGEMNINLQKMNKAEAWDSALVGRGGAEIDAFTKEEVKKKLMLERFQEEHPGFDFSGAEFNGNVPSAREFMGGVKRS